MKEIKIEKKEIVELKVKNEKFTVKNSWESDSIKNDVKNDFKNQINNEKVENKKSEIMSEILVEKVDKKLVFDSWANDSYNIKNAKNNNIESYKTEINIDEFDSNRNLNDIGDKNGQYGQNNRNNKSDNDNNKNKNNDNNSKYNYNYKDNLSPERGTFSLTSMEHSNTPASPISPRASDVIPNNRNYISQKNREGKENQNDVSNDMKNGNENENDNKNKSKFLNNIEKKDSSSNMKIAGNDEKKEKFDEVESKNNFENSKGTSTSVKKGRKKI